MENAGKRVNREGIRQKMVPASHSDGWLLVPLKNQDSEISSF